MSKTFEAKVEAARAAARERFKHLADIPDAETADTAIDPENPPLSEAQLSAMRPAAEVTPKLVAESMRRRAGRPKAAVVKEAVSIRLDQDVLIVLRAKGDGWQTWVNGMLRTTLDLPQGSESDLDRIVGRPSS